MPPTPDELDGYVVEKDIRYRPSPPSVMSVLVAAAFVTFSVLFLVWSYM